MDSSERTLGALAAFATSVTWAFASARYAETSRAASGVRVNLVRASVATLVWGAVWLASEGPTSASQLGLRPLLFLAGSITCSYAVGDNVFFAAARRIGISAALAIATIYPLWAALFGAVYRGEPFGVARALGLGLCLSGVAALVLQSRAAAHEAHAAAHRAPLAGVVLALATSLFWAGNAVFLKLGAEGISLYQANAVRFGIGTLLLLAQLPFQPRQAAGEGVSWRALSLSLALPLAADTGLGSICYTYGITHTDLALGATLSSLSPLVSLPIAAAYGSERITLRKVLAVGATVAGVVLLAWP